MPSKWLPNAGFAYVCGLRPFDDKGVEAERVLKAWLWNKGPVISPVKCVPQSRPGASTESFIVITTCQAQADRVIELVGQPDCPYTQARVPIKRPSDDLKTAQGSWDELKTAQGSWDELKTAHGSWDELKKAQGSWDELKAAPSSWEWTSSWNSTNASWDELKPAQSSWDEPKPVQSSWAELKPDKVRDTW